MRDVVIEGSPFIGYGLLDFKGLSLGFFCRNFDDNRIYVVRITADFFVPAVSIVLDYGTKAMKVFHCGASSKDAGKKITTITEIKEVDIYKETIKNLLANQPLHLV